MEAVGLRWLACSHLAVYVITCMHCRNFRSVVRLVLANYILLSSLVINLIDLYYPYSYFMSDTSAHCSGDQNTRNSLLNRY